MDDLEKLGQCVANAVFEPGSPESIENCPIFKVFSILDN